MITDCTPWVSGTNAATSSTGSCTLVAHIANATPNRLNAASSVQIRCAAKRTRPNWTGPSRRGPH